MVNQCRGHLASATSLAVHVSRDIASNVDVVFTEEDDKDEGPMSRLATFRDLPRSFYQTRHS